MSVKRFQSLAQKAPPIIPIGSKKRNIDKCKVQIRSSSPCPQSSVANHQQVIGKNKIYSHKMRIDYGRLQRPKNVQLCEYRATQLDQDTKVSTISFCEYLSTKRINTFVSSISKQQLLLKNTQKKSKSRINTQIQMEKSQPTAVQAPQNLKCVSRAYSTQKISLQKLRAYTELMKMQSKKKQMKSRVVKMFVGGGSRKTKIFCYPDTSDYQKLCNLN